MQHEPTLLSSSLLNDAYNEYDVTFLFPIPAGVDVTVLAFGAVS